MININLDPVMVQWGPIAIEWHGLLLAAGVILGYVVFRFESQRLGLERDRLGGYLLSLSIAGLVGARLAHVFLYDWHSYATQPARILALWDGGLAVYGGLIGGILAAVGYARWQRLSFWRLADATAVGIVAGMIVGRIGCTIAGDVAGVPTDGSWGLVYWHPSASIPADLLGVPTFPAPSMMQLWNVGLLLLLLAQRKRLQLQGALFL
ncbi:MAG TPA: prolipoprotein diacylglyceryl transferase [Anaerolineae bacterium]|nr:prolipoprotein diacylglyceryl transferase [Anaerolineae bacterium]